MHPRPWEDTLLRKYGREEEVSPLYSVKMYHGYFETYFRMQVVRAETANVSFGSREQGLPNHAKH